MFDLIKTLIITLVISGYTVYQGIREWKDGNRLGALGIYIIAVTIVAIHVWLKVFKYS